MRFAILAIAFVVLMQGTAVADEFKARVFLVEGKKVSFVKEDGTSRMKGLEGRPITLSVADNVLILQGGYNEATKQYEGAIVESGLDYDLFKRFKVPSKTPKWAARYIPADLVTNAENKITEIRLNDERAVRIVKVEGNSLTMIQMWGSGFYGGKEEGPPRTNHATDKTRIVKGWLNPETRKFEATEVEGGLKNEIFKSTVHARVIFGSDVEGVLRIRVFDKAKINDKK